MASLSSLFCAHKARYEITRTHQSQICITFAATWFSIGSLSSGITAKGNSVFHLSTHSPFHMTTTTSATFKHWMDSLLEIDVPKELINTALVKSLQKTKINPSTMTEETFQAIITADTPEDAGIQYTQEAAALHGDQDFLLECINWRMAWEHLSIMERSSVHPTADPKKWLIVLEGRD